MQIGGKNNAQNTFQGESHKPHRGTQLSNKIQKWGLGVWTLTEPYCEFDGYIRPAVMKNTDGVGGIDVNHETLGQFTGFTDKNGVKILE